MFNLLKHPRPLDPASVQFLQRVAQANRPSMADMTPENARVSYEALNALFDFAPEQVQSTRNLSIPVSGGKISARLYEGDGVAADLQTTPLLIFAHGGGFVVGGLEGYDSLCRMLANAIQCKVLALDYRMAPEHRFPTAADDVYAAWHWAYAHADALGVNAQRIAGIGDSAGGNLTAQATARLRAEGLPVAGQGLVYPAGSEKNDTASDKAYASGYLIDRRTMDWFMDNYIDPSAAPVDERLNLRTAENLGHAIPTYFQLAECDPLVDEAMLFANALHDAGSDVKMDVYSGMLHGFYHMPKLFTQAVDARRDTVAWLKSVFA